ncbi:MAG: type IV secretory system conjugative DNA transfer family protein [Acidimicrobiales bacterium]|nr:type IV secretory system conjugative DNA transfer family protein [Acidimicrobiales bacterium]
MERNADEHVDPVDSCLLSTAALHEVHRSAGHSIYVGSGSDGWTWAGPQRSTLVLGPPRSGKTSSLVIPNILLWGGPVVSTSTKPDVLRATARSRGCDGWTFLYDPSGEIECPRTVERVGWSPLSSAAHWDAVVVTADAMVGAGRLHGLRDGTDHWTERAGALLSTLLHAAALEQLPMEDVLRWIDRHHGARALQILASRVGDEATATALLAGLLATDSREQSGIWSTASGVLAAYRTEAALASTRLPPLHFEEFCAGANTLYVCSTGRRQRQFAPLVVAMVGDVRDATYARARSAHPGAPTLLALDEVANIAPIPDLPAMVSEGAGQGLLVLACLQDLSQARSRWGGSAEGFLSLFGTTVVLRGIGDTRTLRDISALAGQRDRTATTVSRTVGRWGRIRPSTSVGSTREARLPVDAVAHGTPGCALVLGPHKEVEEVRLTPSHQESPWRELSTPERTWTRGDARGRGR